MKKLKYSLRLFGLGESPAFTEATREELRVLLSLAALEGCLESENSLASYAGVSLSRCKAALVFWEGEGFIIKKGDDGIVEEFEERLVRGEIDEEPAVDVAKHIRNENLASMIDECAALMGQACLSNAEVKSLTGLNSQYGLSPEFILTLAAHLAARNCLTVKKLCNRAIDLEREGCDDLDKLESYIKNLENGKYLEYFRVMGIKGRGLSQSEREYFKKWLEEFGYSSNIVSEAYDIAVLNTGRGDLRYMDAILSAWHEGGCKTLTECQAMQASDRAKRTADNTKKKTSKSKPETPRYGNFDVDEAFMAAVERSFGQSED